MYQARTIALILFVAHKGCISDIHIGLPIMAVNDALKCSRKINHLVLSIDNADRNIGSFAPSFYVLNPRIAFIKTIAQKSEYLRRSRGVLFYDYVVKKNVG